MIAILDTNVLISALFDPNSVAAMLLRGWEDGRFALVSSEEQLREFRRVSRYPKVAQRMSAPRAGKLVLRVRKVARLIDSTPKVDVSRDPFDNFLLAMAQVSQADYLVTGDKSDLLILERHDQTRIVTVRQFAELLGL